MILQIIRKAVWYFFYKPEQFFDSILTRLWFLFPDKLYLSLRFRCKMGYWINWKNPKTFSEKLQWLKLYDRKAEYTTMVDKYAVKNYVAKRIGKEYIIPTLGVWDSPEDIEWGRLPKTFVLKTTHGGGGGGVLICRDKSVFDKEAAITMLKKALKSDIYSAFREWPYKDVPRRIIAETLLENKGLDLPDYKFFCFGGKVEYFKIDLNRFVEHRANYYSPSCSLIPLEESCFPANPEAPVVFPKCIGKMMALAEKLAAGHSFLRVDFYNVGNEIFFGELTFYPSSGMTRLRPEEWDEKIGKLLKFPLKRQ